MDIEYSVLSALLYDPKQIPKVELKEEWFFGSKNKEIARVLLDENVNMVEPLALYEEIRRRNHLTLITAEHLDNMSIDGYGVKLEEVIPTLKKRFYQERFDSASRKYANA